LSLVMAIGFGLSLSTTAMVARRIGEKDPAGAAVAGVQAIAIGVAISALVGIPCLIFASDLLRLMGASPQIVATGSGYARIALGGSGAIMLLFLNNAIFRGAGDAAIAMRLLWVSNIINLILDPCLIFGWGPFPKLGVTGAALATFTGRSIGVLYQFYRLLRGSERIRILRSQIHLNLGVLWRLLRVSFTGILQFAIAHTSWIGLVRIVSIFGSAALAGYTIAIRIVIFIPAHHQLRQHRLRLRHGHAPGLQRRRRHHHSHHREFLRLLAARNSAGLFPRNHCRHALPRRLLVHRHRRRLHRCRQHHPLPPRPLEASANIAALV